MQRKIERLNLWILKDQSILLTKNVLRQKFKHGPVDTCCQVCIPFWFSLILFFIVNGIIIFAGLSNFNYIVLPPLSSNGVFNISLGGGFVLLENPCIYYSPDDHIGVSKLMNNLVETYPDISIQSIANPNDLINQFKSNIRTSYASIEFDLTEEQISTGLFVTNQSAPANVSYSIRMNQVGIILPLSTNNNDSYVYNDYSTSADSWWRSGYLTLKQFIDTELAKQYDSVQPEFSISGSIQRYFRNSGLYDDMPTGSVASSRYHLFRILAPVFLTIILFYPQLSMSTEAVRDIEINMKDILEISGMYPWSFYLSYFIASFILGQICMYLTFAMISKCLGIVQFGSYVGLLTCYSPSLMAFSLAFSRSTKSDNFALPFIAIICGLAGIGTLIATDTSINVGVKNFLSLFFPPISFANGVNAIESYVYNNPDATTIDVSYVDTQRNTMSVANATGFLVVGSIFWLLVARYYPFSEFFRSWKRTTASPLLSKDIEQPSDTILSAIDLSQVYPDGNHAVKGLNLSVKSGEILVFLGANGSGKTTTLDMICGVREPSSGDVLIGSYSITKQRFEARRNIGVCLQRDILWEKVSVEEHLRVFASLHGLKGEQLEKAVSDMIVSLGFPDKAGCTASELSGGQRRRLCVGISMVGQNKLVILDEPTAGLDSLSRRQVWELIRRNRGDRGMILTTHYMDEADLLGDRIVIINDGSIVAEGTSASLKRQFGPGYTLRFSMQPNLLNFEPIISISKRHIPNATVSSNAGAELCLNLPMADSSKFSALFSDLEENLTSLGALSFGIERCTLEDVFMRVINEEKSDVSSELSEEQFTEKLQLVLKRGEISPSDTKLTRKHTYLMLRKRFYQLLRSTESLSTFIFVPLFWLIVGAIVVQMFPTDVVNNSLPSSTSIEYNSYVGNTFPISAASQSTATEYASSAGIPVAEVLYTGVSYTDTQSYVYATEGSSSNAIYYGNSSIFSVMYNAEQPLNLVSLFSILNQGAINFATASKMQVTSAYGEFPQYNGYMQIYIAVAFTIILGLCAGVYSGGTALLLAHERLTLLKHQQLFSGASKRTYWLANTLFDVVILLGLTALMAIFLAIASSSFQNEGFFVAIIAGICYSFAMVPRIQLFSLYFSETKSVQTVWIYGTVMLVIAMIALYLQIITFTASNSGNYKNMYNFNTSGATGILCFAVIVEPSIGYVMILLFQSNYLGVRDNVSGYPNALNPLVGGYLCGILVASGVVHGLALIFMESDWHCCADSTQKQLESRKKTSRFQKLINSYSLECTTKPMSITSLFSRDNSEAMNTLNEDQNVVHKDVSVERDRVDQLMKSVSSNENSIVIHRVSKLFKGNGITSTDKLAVNNVSLSIQEGEIVGLIGANGAGKTTLLKIVSGLERQFAGDALIHGYSITKQRRLAQMSMGFCPQFDTLIQEMSVRENLMYFAVLKGLSDDFAAGADISTSTAYQTVNALIHLLRIQIHAEKRISALSGGTRRKVSLGVALLGAPPTAYLDEPSTGLDCTAYRHMWRLLRAVARTQTTALILTTHNMRECEAVCSRIAIMKNGSFVALGSSQHLRTAHGEGYKLEIEAGPSCNCVELKEFVESNFAGAKLEGQQVDDHQTILKFEIPSERIRLSKIFSVFEENKSRLHIAEYAVSQSSLEEVFINKIRPADATEVDDEDEMSRILRRAATQPNGSDYRIHYIMWFCSAMMPGLHRFYLGDYWNAWAYFLTANWCMLGWWWDFWRLPRLVQLSVAKFGHTSCCCDCSFCGCDKQSRN